MAPPSPEKITNATTTPTIATVRRTTIPSGDLKNSMTCCACGSGLRAAACCIPSISFSRILSPAWNTMVIRLDGRRTVVTVNGVLVTDFTEVPGWTPPARVHD